MLICGKVGMNGELFVFFAGGGGGGLHVCPSSMLSKPTNDHL